MGSIQKHFNRELSDLSSEASKVDSHTVLVDKMAKVDGPTKIVCQSGRSYLFARLGRSSHWTIQLGEVTYGI